MNSQVTCVVLFCLFALSYAALSAEHKAIALQKLNECKVKEGTSDDEFKKHLSSGGDVSTPAGKCLIACFQESIGIVKDGVVQNDVAIQLGKIAHGDDDKTVAAMKKLHEICGNINDPDRCELAYKRFTCLRTEGPKVGLPILSLE